MKKALIVLSGGQDSTTCLAWAKEEGYECHAVTFDYGQRHAREIESARIVAHMLGVASHEFINIGAGVLMSTSPLVSNNELEQYADHTALPGGIEKTFVPMRNQLFLTIAFNRAVAHGCEAIVTGVCQEDFGGYPDCREEFIAMIEAASNVGLYGIEQLTHNKEGFPDTKIQVLTPLKDTTKAESVYLANSLPGCWEALAYSHTAYDGAYPPVGHDHATLLRAKGFIEAGLPDPLVVRAWREGVMELPDTANYNVTRDEAANELHQEDKQDFGAAG